jgi:hypothetical protein
LTLSFRPHYGPKELTQSLTEMSIRNISWG